MTEAIRIDCGACPARDTDSCQVCVVALLLETPEMPHPLTDSHPAQPRRVMTTTRSDFGHGIASDQIVT